MIDDAFLETAWSDHGDRPREVADRLAAALPQLAAPGEVPPFVRLLTHVYGEHLGEWRQGVALLEAIGSRAVLVADTAAAGALARAVATLRCAGGDAAAVAALGREDRVAATAGAAAIFTGRADLARAIPALDDALRLADGGLPDGSPAIRALAVAGNNLAAALEEKPDRDGAQTQAMVAAARAGLRYWTRAGTWLEEERAHYRLARTLLAAGDPAAAVASAARCVDVCAQHEADAFERFFGHAVLAVAARAAGDAEGFATNRRHALEAYGRVPEADRRWCGQALAELGEDA